LAAWMEQGMDDASFALALLLLLRQAAASDCANKLLFKSISPIIMQLNFAFLNFTKNLKICSPTVLYLTYVF
jgi:hypothetical protein